MLVQEQKSYCWVSRFLRRLKWSCPDGMRETSTLNPFAAPDVSVFRSVLFARCDWIATTKECQLTTIQDARGQRFVDVE